MISLKTVFNYIKFANELTNKVSFMFNGIKKYGSADFPGW